MIKFSKKSIFISLIGILVVTLGVIILISGLQQRSIAFTIDGKKFTKKYYNELVSLASSHNVQLGLASKQIIEINKDKIVAQKLKVEISSNEIIAGAKSQFRIGQDEKLDSYENLIGWEAAFHHRLDFIQNGGIEGAAFFFPFDQLFIKPSIQNYPLPQGFGDEAKITDLKLYAKSQAVSARKQIEENRITDAKLLSNLSGDSRLTYANSGNDSFMFQEINQPANDSQMRTDSSLPDYMLNQINLLNQKPGVTEIALQDTTFRDDMLGFGVSNPVAVAYYFIHVTNFQKPNQNIRAQVNGTLDNLKVISHV